MNERYSQAKRAGPTLLRDGVGELTNHMFMVLADWLIDVQVSRFSLKFGQKLDLETVHIAFDIVRRALTTEGFKLNHENPQIIGTAAMKIAECWFKNSQEHYRMELANSYSKLTMGQVTPEQLINQEKEILNKLNFDVVLPNLITWAKFLAEAFFPEK